MQLKKFFLIAFKDLRLVLRDRSALLLMLLAPFVLTLGLGALSGRFSGSSTSGVSDIPVVIVNEDQGELGEALINVFQSDELEGLVEPGLMDDLLEARTLVDEDQCAAVIFIPEGFTESVFSAIGEANAGDGVQIEFYASPSWPTSVGVLRSILDEFTNQVEVGRISVEVIITQLIENGIIAIDQASLVGSELGQELAQAGSTQSSIQIKNETSVEDETVEFDVLAYMAPGMAVMFLMYTVTDGGRSLLFENQTGTLPRLLVAPTLPAYVIGGKAFGIFLKSLAQLVILILGTSLLFNLHWGDPLGVALLIVSAAFAATGWGILFAAVLKTPGQISVTGSAVMLLFGIMGGSFFDLNMLPDWISVVNKITPNAWAIDGFYILSIGGKLDNILTNILALVIMGIVLSTFAGFWIRKHGLARK